MAKNNNGQPEVSLSLLAKRIRQFKRIKRGYYALIFIVTLYVLSFFNPYFFNNRALIMRYEGQTYFPVTMGKKVILEQDLGREGYGEADYLMIKQEIEERKALDPTVTDFVIMPFVPYSWNGRDRNEYRGLHVDEDTGVVSIQLLPPPNPPRQFHLEDADQVESLLNDPAIAIKYGLRPEWLRSAMFDEQWTREIISDPEMAQHMLDSTDLVKKVLSNGTLARTFVKNKELVELVLSDTDRAQDAFDNSSDLKTRTDLEPDIQRMVDDPRVVRDTLANKDFAGDILGEIELVSDMVLNSEKYRKFQNKPQTVRNIIADPAWITSMLDDDRPAEEIAAEAKAAVDAFIEGEGISTRRMSHVFGTDKTGRDVLVRLAYGFRISITFALLVLCLTYSFGCALGAAMGYYAGLFDIIVQRLVEIWSSMPFLYTMIIISSIVRPNFYMLIIVLGIFRWIGLTYYMRGEFYKEKRKDYVIAAVATGANDRQIIFTHILPNSLTPIISFAPFAVVAYISSLVGLDFLGFGLPAPTPSWGEMVGKGLENVKNWWLVMCPLAAMFVTLLSVVFIGEAVREAFDPRAHQRLR